MPAPVFVTPPVPPVIAPPIVVFPVPATVRAEVPLKMVFATVSRLAELFVHACPDPNQMVKGLIASPKVTAPASAPKLIPPEPKVKLRSAVLSESRSVVPVFAKVTPPTLVLAPN